VVLSESLNDDTRDQIMTFNAHNAEKVVIVKYVRSCATREQSVNISTINYGDAAVSNSTLSFSMRIASL
jgi:hypothetical protein